MTLIDYIIDIALIALVILQIRGSRLDLKTAIRDLTNGQGADANTQTVEDRLKRDEEMIEYASPLFGQLRQTGTFQPISPITRPCFTSQQNMVGDIGGPKQGHCFEQCRAYDQRIGLIQKRHGLILRPAVTLCRSSANGDVKSAAQFIAKGRRRRDRDFHVRVLGMKLLKPWNQPTHRKAGRRVDAEHGTHRRVSARFRGRDDPIEGQADLGGKSPRRWCCRHAPSCSHEEALTKPCLQCRDLAADGAMGQSELGSSLGVAAGPSGDLKDTQRIKWRETTHGNREKNRQNT